MRFLNNLDAVLTAPLALGGLQLPISTESAARLTAGVDYLLTLTNSADPAEQSSWEVVKARRTGSVVAIVRAVEGVESSWAQGARVFCTITAGALNQVLARLDAAEQVQGQLQQNNDALQQALNALTERVAALEQGGPGPDPTPSVLTDGAGNILVDGQGNTLIMQE
ncbi:hypothetical protein [Pseudomonas pseudonitroreducens]|uniref:hypothetical protein n=1 Tax=Pseudomonas pseudonitroreducens TaxID=2892326 RepID=UPI001F2211A1|nr:hypothetical protein [Pseudomonas pseudonitroreducens]